LGSIGVSPVINENTQGDDGDASDETNYSTYPLVGGTAWGPFLLAKPTVAIVIGFA